jgi:ankyrin repeat protein
VNKCTSDGWLPIQLAINLKNTHYIEKLLEENSINLNLVTSRGSPLHTAAKLGNKEILEMILEKDVDINMKDTSGKTALDICQDQTSCELIKKYE